MLIYDFSARGVWYLMAKLPQKAEFTFFPPHGFEVNAEHHAQRYGKVETSGQMVTICKA